MKLHALYNQAGEILAAVPLDHPGSEQHGIPLPRPMPQKGQLAAELTVPPEFAHLPLYELCTQLSVDTRSDRPALVRANPKKG